MQRWRLQQSPRLVLALCAAAAVAWVLVQLSDAQQSPAPSSREPLVCPAVGSQPAAQLKTEMKARLASKPGDAPAAYHCYAKALTEVRRGLHTRTRPPPVPGRTQEDMQAYTRVRAVSCVPSQAHCRDLGPLNLDPQVKIKALADKSILVKIDPLPVYLNVYNGSQDIVSGHLVKGTVEDTRRRLHNRTPACPHMRTHTCAHTQAHTIGGSVNITQQTKRARARARVCVCAR